MKPFSKEKVTKLYEEAETGADTFLHRVMKSNWTVFFLLGTAIAVLFLTFS